MFSRLFKSLLILFCLLVTTQRGTHTSGTHEVGGSGIHYFPTLHASGTTPVEPDTVTLLRKSKSALQRYLLRPYKVVRGDTIPGEMIGELLTYEVKRKDTLLKIALKFDVSYMSIVYANKIKKSHLIRKGDKLFIPKRMIVPKKIYKGLLLNLPEYRLYLFNDTQVVKVYPICIGLTTWRTLQGKFKIRNKAINPEWHVPEEMAERLMMEQKIVEPCDTNPLGDRWIGLSLPNTGIHSTIDTMSIGRTSSHGCIRLYPHGIHELFEIVKVGDEGEIIYEPIKIAVVGHKIMLEIHRDVYKLVPKMKDEVIQRLEALGLMEFVDLEKVGEVVKERRGIPIMVGSTIKEDTEVIR